MADGDLTDLTSRVRARGGFNPNDQGLTSAVLTTLLNAAAKQVASEQDWPWLEATATITTAIGTNTYTVPADYARTISIVDTTLGELLDERPIDDIDRFTTTGHPTQFALYGLQVVLGPTPNAVLSLTHRYVRQEKTLVSGSDTLYLPARFNEGVVEWATMLGHDMTRQYDKAAEAASRYNVWLQSVADSLDSTQNPRRTQVRASTAPGDLGDLDDRLLIRGSFNPTDIRLSQTARIAFINSALKQIASERDWPWLFTSEVINTVAGTQAYTPNVNWVRTDSVIDTAIGNSLAERQSEEMARVTNTGRPRAFAIDADKLLLGPIPDGAYALTHRYVQRENTLSALADKPLIPNAFDEGVVEWAAMLAFGFLGLKDQADQASARYAMWLKSVQDTVDRTRRPRRVQVRPGLPV